MISWFFRLFKGQHHRKFLQKVNPLVAKINLLEAEYQKLPEEALKAKTAEFKERYQKGESLDHLLPEAFAAVKNAARRLVGQKIIVCEHELTWGMVHFDVQLIGGIALHWGRIAEMATGEGKTLVATLPLYLNALSGRNCQLVTVNDYLVRRDSEWMSYLYNYLGLTVGCIQNQMDSAERRQAYAADITYGAASEFGFDYLRDNGMATRKEDQVQRDHFFCIVDEVDSILVDEARTPLIISGPVQVEREAPFPVFKPAIERLVGLQNRLGNRLATEAKEVLEASVDGDAADEAIKKLLQVRMGMPKNRVLMRLMEQGPIRKKLDRLEVEMNGDFRRDELYHLKEELYFTIEEKHHQADLTELGRQTLSPNDPDGFMLPDLPMLFMELDRRPDLSADDRQRLKLQGEDKFQQVAENIHCIGQLLRAYCLYERDVEYVLQDGKVVIVDENTGRIMPGRRWSDGLHQAVEAKEGVAIQEESKTYATITIQNYFRLYDKLAGMTGTAETEATEFNDIYKLEVVTIPTHRPCIRKDLNDVIYKTRREKYNAALRDIKEAHDRGQPVLVGTTSVDSSEVLSKMLKRENIKHSVLNAKFHAQEAEIVSLAGQKAAVTIATNMAGRGTDIKLGEGVDALGGLFVLGTERHESRRIDRQLRGRCARQGDPGASKFFISLEDNLMRLFASAGPISRILENSFEEGEELAHPLLNRSIESAQKKVEEHNYAIRKRLLKYDDVLNQQREVIYGIRNDALGCESPREILFEMVEEELRVRLEGINTRRKEKSDLEGLLNWLNMTFPVGVPLGELESLEEEQMLPWLVDKVRIAYLEKASLEDPELFKQIERYTIIRPIDRHWQDHLTEMEELRRSVSLRSYGQKDPLNEYKSEAFTYFEQMMGLVRTDICNGLFRAASSLDSFQKMIQVLAAQQARAEESGPTTPTPTPALASKGSSRGAEDMQLPKIEPVRAMPKVGRNDPCPCGSGKKYKKCCGQGHE